MPGITNMYGKRRKQIETVALTNKPRVVSVIAPCIPARLTVRFPKRDRYKFEAASRRIPIPSVRYPRRIERSFVHQFGIAMDLRENLSSVFARRIVPIKVWTPRNPAIGTLTFAPTRSSKSFHESSSPCVENFLTRVSLSLSFPLSVEYVRNRGKRRAENWEQYLK